MPTREETIFADKIKLALRDIVEPCTIKDLCEHCKELCRRPEKVKKCLEFMHDGGVIESHGDEFMLSVNVTEEIRGMWLERLTSRGEEANKRKSSFSCYADVVKRRTSAPGGGAYGSDSEDNKVYKRSASDVFPSSSSGMPPAEAAREGRPVEQIGSNENNSASVSHHHHHHEYCMVVNQTVHHNIHLNDCDLSSNNRNMFQFGDNTNLQLGDQNQMNFQATPVKHKKKKRK